MVGAFSYNIKLDLSGLKTIYWPLVFLMMARYFGLSEKVIFFIVVATIVYMMGIYKKVILPRISGLWFYGAVVIVGIVMGLILNGTRNLARDIFYIVPTIAIMVLGYYIERINSKDKYSMLNTMILYGGLISVMSFIKAMSSFSTLSTFDGIRACFGRNSIYEVSIVFCILFYKKIIKREICISKWFDRALGLFMTIQIVLCLGRTALIQTAATIIIMFLWLILKNIDLKRNVKKALGFIGVVVVSIIILSRVMPQSTWDELTSKFQASAEEIDSSQTFESTEDAMDNWRGYEIEQAKKQWENNSLVYELVGEGLGKGVKITYVPYTWVNVVDNGEIPILHNGYYTILPKMGLIGVCALIWLLLSNIILVLKSDKKFYDDVIILSAITVGMAINTYVLRGPVSQIAPFTWALLVGTINCKIRKV